MIPSDVASVGLRRWLAHAWLPLLVVVVGYVGVAVAALRPYDYNPTGPIRIGAVWHGGERFWTASTRVEPGVGYDGQWFFYLAHDPLLHTPELTAFFDRPAYRSARVLYPSLAWLLALGQPSALPWSMLAVNLLAVLGGTLACLDILRRLDANRWLVLAFAFSPPFLIGVSAMLSEPTALALIPAGVALALRGRHRSAGAVLALSVLAREPSMLVPLGLGLYALGRLDWRRGAAYLLPLALPIGWHLWVWSRLGSLPSSESGANFAVPFSGVYYRFGVLLGWHPPLLGETVPSANVLSEALIVATSAAIIVVGLLKIVERRDAFAWLLWLQAALAVMTSPDIWVDLYSYGRALGPLYLAFGLMLLTDPRRVGKLPSRLDEWTIPVPSPARLRRWFSLPVTSQVSDPLSTMKRSEKPY